MALFTFVSYVKAHLATQDIYLVLAEIQTHEPISYVLYRATL